MDALEQKMKEKLLEGLIEHMEGKMGDDMGSKFPKAMEVSVAAPDSEHLAQGLDHAKSLAEGGDLGEPQDEGSDEDRLMALLGDDDEEDDDRKGV
jgi:hypothetical protein